MRIAVPSKQRPGEGRLRLVALLCAAATGGLAAANGCSATNEETRGFTTGGDPTTGATTGGPGTGGGAGAGVTSSTGEGGGLILPDGGSDAPDDVFMNPCGTECGPTELCDPAHLGLDDDCDGNVDEVCDCVTGQAHFCFKGDPSYHATPGCYDGTQKCSENGKWGECLGGVHATEGCFSADLTGCHPISAVPFQDVQLAPGTGNFSADAVPGTEVWTVACPAGVSPCPAVGGSSPADDFKPLQSGEYTVTYTKGLAGGGTDTCDYPLFVGAPGLRVEASWEHDVVPCPAGACGVDVDLHLHEPSTTTPWAFYGDAPQDCGYGNCTVSAYQFPFGAEPSWFPNGNSPPDPVNWFKDPVFEKNICYFSPRGAGQAWQDLGMGCHNPRLDIDNIYCDPNVGDPENGDFCAPENINIDFPPKAQWLRVAVHYFSNHGEGYDVHPNVKIYCNGALAADLGAKGFYDPEQPVTFAPGEGESVGTSNKFWLVADVAFASDVCETAACVVKPLYASEPAKTPFFMTDAQALTTFGPPYPPLP